MPNDPDSILTTSTEAQAPPIGIIPSSIFYEKRLADLDAALKRYIDAGMRLPDIWLSERRLLLKILPRLPQPKFPPPPPAESKSKGWHYNTIAHHSSPHSAGFFFFPKLFTLLSTKAITKIKPGITQVLSCLAPGTRRCSNLWVGDIEFTHTFLTIVDG